MIGLLQLYEYFSKDKNKIFFFYSLDNPSLVLIKFIILNRENVYRHWLETCKVLFE